MPVHPAGFSERVFEFSFNAEFGHRNRAILAAAPHIPTQNEEVWLGYDVEFEIAQRHGAVHSIALQHKVARYVDGMSASNRHYWEAVGERPYFAFQLDSDQYNVIHDIASARLHGVEFYYCAPLFQGHARMNSHFLAQSVEQNSIWIDVANSGPITDDERHTIVYSTCGGQAFRFSDKPTKLRTTRFTGQERAAREQTIELSEHKHLKKIYETAFQVVSDYWPKRRGFREQGKFVTTDAWTRPPQRERIDDTKSALNALRKLFSEYYGVSWLVETRIGPLPHDDPAQPWNALI